MKINMFHTHIQRGKKIKERENRLINNVNVIIIKMHINILKYTISLCTFKLKNG